MMGVPCLVQEVELECHRVAADCRWLWWVCAQVTALDGSVSVAAADAVEPPRHPQSVGGNASASADEGRATSAAARGDAVAAGAAAAVGDANGGGGEAEEERAAVPLRSREEMEEMALSAAAKLEAKQLERAKVRSQHPLRSIKQCKTSLLGGPIWA